MVGRCGVVSNKMYLHFSSGHFPQELVSAGSVMEKSVDIYQALWKNVVLCAFVFLLWSHVDANSQTVPYMTFMGNILPNNSYVDVSLVGDPLSGGEGVQCHTDLTTCCNSDQGMDRGDWYAPDSEDRLPLESEKEDSADAIYEHHENQIVTLYKRSTAVIQSGMYRCEIAVSVSGRGTIYVGLYETGCIRQISLFVYYNYYNGIHSTVSRRYHHIKYFNVH